MAVPQLRIPKSEFRISRSFQPQPLSARLINVIYRDVYDALPVLEGAVVALVAGPAWQAAFHDDVFTPEGTVAVTAGGSEDRNDGCPDRCCKVHRTCIAADEKFGSLAQRYQFFQIR